MLTALEALEMERDDLAADKVQNSDMHDVDISLNTGFGKVKPTFMKVRDNLRYGSRLKDLDRKLTKMRASESPMYKAAAKYVKPIACEVCGYEGDPTNLGRCPVCKAIGGIAPKETGKAERYVSYENVPVEYFGSRSYVSL